MERTWVGTTRKVETVSGRIPLFVDAVRELLSHPLAIPEETMKFSLKEGKKKKPNSTHLQKSQVHGFDPVP